jgi:hypothetical protein
MFFYTGFREISEVVTVYPAQSAEVSVLPLVIAGYDHVFVEFKFHNCVSFIID